MSLNFHLPKTIQECKNARQLCGRRIGYIEEGEICLKLSADTHDNFPGDKMKRSNIFWKKLVDTEAFQNVAQRINEIEISFFDLDDWEPLLKTLKQSGANIEKLELISCHLSRKGSLLLRKVLKTSKSNNNNNNHLDFRNTEVTTTAGTTSRRSGIIEIKKLKLSSLYGSMAWIDGFLQNKTITHLSLESIPILRSVIQFIQKSPQIICAEIKNLKNDGKRFKDVDVDTGTFNHNELSLGLEKLSIKFAYGERFALSLCQRIGRILRRAKNLEKLTLINFRSDIPYDFLRDAIHCQNIDLQYSDFDPVALYFLIQGNTDNDGATTIEGKLKEVNLCSIKDASKVEHLLRIVDLSMLDSFSFQCDGLMDSLCRQLAENKGPKHLDMFVHHTSLSETATRLAPNLVGNDKIERLEIRFFKFGNDIEPQQELFNSMSQMPRLRSWSLDNVLDCCWDLDEEESDVVTKWNEWIRHQVQSNPSIQDIQVPEPFELGDDIKEMLLFNKHWRNLLCCHDQMSSGIWSPALSQIDQVGLMFRVVQQIPSLFQDAVNVHDADAKANARYVVPHDINCHKRRKIQHSA